MILLHIVQVYDCGDISNVIVNLAKEMIAFLERAESCFKPEVLSLGQIGDLYIEAFYKI